MGKIAASVIIYHPGPDVQKNISSYLDHVEHLYIADNSVPKYIFPSTLLEHPKITVISNGGNEGIAKRLNQMANLAIKDGYEWLLTMDQDSYFNPDHISSYLEYMQAYADTSQVAMFGVETVQKPELIGDFTEKVIKLITSGSLLNLALYPTVGPFDENLFIDEVDYEYCYRAGRKGYSIIQFTHIYLEHQLAKDVKVKTLTGSVKKTKLHPPLRSYYMFRNYLYVRAKYKAHYPKEIREQGAALFHWLKNNLFYGSSKWDTLKMLFRAVSDYKTGKMGKKM